MEILMQQSVVWLSFTLFVNSKLINNSSIWPPPPGHFMLLPFPPTSQVVTTESELLLIYYVSCFAPFHIPCLPLAQTFIHSSSVSHWLLMSRIWRIHYPVLGSQLQRTCPKLRRNLFDPTPFFSPTLVIITHPLHLIQNVDASLF